MQNKVNEISSKLNSIILIKYESTLFNDANSTRKKITALDDDCLEAIFQYLDLNELVNKLILPIPVSCFDVLHVESTNQNIEIGNQYLMRKIG